MNNVSTFFRLLTSPIPAKSDDLRRQIDSLNQGLPAEGIFQADPADFAAIPSTPFSYWVGEAVYKMFFTLPNFESEGRTSKAGLCSGDDFRFLRLYWEVQSKKIAHGQDGDQVIEKTFLEQPWVYFAKGGAYSPFYSDVYLLVNWGENGKEIKDGASDGSLPGARPQNTDFFFLPGITFSSRPHKKGSFRALPKGCIFAHNGPALFAPHEQLLALIALTNSAFFNFLVQLQMGRGTFGSGQTMTYEIGLIQKAPIPARLPYAKEELAALASQACGFAHKLSYSDETTHVFCLPALLYFSGLTLSERLQNLAQSKSEHQSKLAALQTQIDALVAELYGMQELTANSSSIQSGEESRSSSNIPDSTQSADDEESEAETAPIMQPVSVVSDFLMWCVGVAFGRWDVRFALDPNKLPPLPGPFDPLPVCSPGMLTGADGLPLSASPHGYPLPVAWDGFLVDDPDHPNDIVAAVRNVIRLLWPANAEAIEAEACQVLGVPDLRAWLRDPRGFFTYHIRRYSKSRRKAPIYWLLQSAKRNYGIWLYYPRLNPDSLFRAGREYADAKLNLENGRLEDMQNSLAAALGSGRKIQERKLAAQAALAAELKSFQKALDAAALLEVKPDLNDGVLLNIAPLHELVSWKEAGSAWRELLQGKYEWSSISQWLRRKGLVKG